MDLQKGCVVSREPQAVFAGARKKPGCHMPGRGRVAKRFLSHLVGMKRTGTMDVGTNFTDEMNRASRRGAATSTPPDATCQCRSGRASSQTGL